MTLMGGPASAQMMSDSYNFLKGVRDRNGDDVQKLMDKPGFSAIDTRDLSSGETALHIVVKRRDVEWLRFLISRGERLDMRDQNGATPLMDAATIGFPEGEAVLVQAGANVNLPNNMGETPLMRAAASQDVDSVRLLLDAGADPTLKDHITGKTARDYALQGSHGEAIARMMDQAKPKKAMIGPHL